MRKLTSREDFIKFWAEYVRTNKDEEWSRQQNILIDSQIEIARDFYKKNKKAFKTYLEKTKKLTN